MTDYFADLLDIMDKESQIYSELTRVQEQKKKIIIENDVKALDAITKKEQGFVKTIVNLESIRAQVIDGFCNFKGIDKIDSIDEIMKHVNDAEKEKLEEKRDKLVKIVDKILQVNDLNSKLLQESMEYIEYTMELTKSLIEEEAGYSEKAMDKTVKVDKNLFDAKI